MWSGPRMFAVPSSSITITRLPLGVINAWSTVGTEYSWPSDVRTTKGTNGTRCSCFRMSSITVALYQKLSAAHYLLTIEPDIEIASDTVDMRFGSPVCAGVFCVRMTKSNVDAGNFFILQNMTDDVAASGVRADSELADAVAVFISAGVSAKLVAQILVLGMQRADAIVFHFDCERIRFEVAKAFA